MVLDDELLARLERVLALRARDLLDHTRPGATETAVVEAFETAGVAPSREAMRWWSWRDGAAAMMLPGMQHLSLETALRARHSLLTIGAVTPDDPPRPAMLAGSESWWHPAWVPISGRVAGTSTPSTAAGR